MLRCVSFCILAVASMAACQQSETQYAPSSPGSHQIAAKQPASPAREEVKEAAKRPEAVEDVTKRVSEVTNDVAKQPTVTIKQATPDTLAQITEPEAKRMPAALPAVAGDPVKGAKIARGKCGACHYFDKERKKVGPGLKGIYGRGPTIDGILFATWDAQALDAWLASPKAVKPKTKMGFKGLAKKQDRDDVIAYLKTL